MLFENVLSHIPRCVEELVNAAYVKSLYETKYLSMSKEKFLNRWLIFIHAV